MQTIDEIFNKENELICCYCGFFQKCPISEKEQIEKLIKNKQYKVICINCDEEFIITE
jgi:hypothetical protein